MDVYLDGLVTLYTLGLRRRCIYPRTGGNAKPPLAETLKDLTAELWSQFVLTYTPANQIRDGKQRNLQIEVADTFDNNKRVVRIKQTYVGAQSR